MHSKYASGCHIALKGVIELAAKPRVTEDEISDHFEVVIDSASIIGCDEIEADELLAVFKQSDSNCVDSFTRSFVEMARLYSANNVRKLDSRAQGTNDLMKYIAQLELDGGDTEYSNGLMDAIRRNHPVCVQCFMRSLLMAAKRNTGANALLNHIANFKGHIPLN